jgi:hypothetical protein
MKDLNLILDKVVSKYTKDTIEYEILENTNELSLVNVYNKNAPGSLLQFEILHNEVPACCVLQKVNVGRSSMVRFMNRLVEEL